MIDGHGDDSYKFKKKIVSNFSSNIFPYADLSGLKAHLCECMNSISSYPEPEPYTLEKKLAKYLGISPENVLVTNGATEAIYLIAQTFKNTTSLIKGPTFSEYEDACRIHGHKVAYLTSAVESDVPLDTKLVWFCNPDNPTGLVIDGDYFKMGASIKGSPYMVLDQSYEYFTQENILSAKDAVKFPRLMQIHSMTKRYGIPGLRLGYITASASLIKKIRACRMPWSVNQLAIEAGYYILSKGIPEKMTMAAYLEETKRFADKLASLEINVLPTSTHFMLVGLRKGYPGDLKKYLAEKHGVLIRDASNFKGLPENVFRVATQTPEENDKLVELIGKWLDMVH